MTQDTGSEKKTQDDGDGFLGVSLLFAFYFLCMAASAYLYWRGTGKPPWA